jgi:hypothetical protein
MDEERGAGGEEAYPHHGNRALPGEVLDGVGQWGTDIQPLDSAALQLGEGDVGIANGIRRERVASVCSLVEIRSRVIPQHRGGLELIHRFRSSRWQSQ